MTDTTNYNYGYPIEAPRMNEESSATSYNKPGLPTPPAGWGKVVTMVDSVDGDDEGPESKDEY